MRRLITVRRRAMTALAAAGAAAGLAAAGCGSHGGPSTAGSLGSSVPATGRVSLGQPVVVTRRANGPSYLTAAGNAKAGGDLYAAWTTYAANPNVAYTWLTRTTDGGHTWSRPERLGSGTASQPQLAVADDGTLYAIWSEFNPHVGLHAANPSCTNPTLLMFAVSRDHGAHWSRARAVAPGNGRVCQLYGSIALGSDGRQLAISWFDYTSDPGADATVVQAVRSTDGGASFGAPQSLANACVCCTARGLAVDGRPALLFRGWQDVGPGGQLRNPVLAVADSAGGWQPTRVVHDDQFRFRVCPHSGLGAATDAHGTSYLSWWTGAPGREGYWYATTHDGLKFSAPVRLTTQHADPMDGDVHVSVDRDQRIWITAMKTPGPDSVDSDSMVMSPDTSVHGWIVDSSGVHPLPLVAARGSEPASAASSIGAAAVWVQGSAIMARSMEAERR